MTKIEQVAAAMALATNGGKWDDGHYCEDHKALWMKRARAAIEAVRDVEVLAILLAGKQSLFSCSEDPEIDDARKCWQAMTDVILNEAAP